MATLKVSLVARNQPTGYYRRLFLHFQVARESNETRVNCLTNHLTSFAGEFYIAPNVIDFESVSNEMTPLPAENLFVLGTVCLIFTFYMVGLVFSRKADNRDKMKVRFSNNAWNSFQRGNMDPFLCDIVPLESQWNRRHKTCKPLRETYGTSGISSLKNYSHPNVRMKSSVNSVCIKLVFFCHFTKTLQL